MKAATGKRGGMGPNWCVIGTYKLQYSCEKKDAESLKLQDYLSFQKKQKVKIIGVE